MNASAASIHDSRPDPDDLNLRRFSLRPDCGFFNPASTSVDKLAEYLRISTGSLDGTGLGPGGTMSRRPRLQFAGAVYHVMARGNRKSTIFHDDEDRRQFLQVVGRAATLHDLRIRAFCLMGNHYHFILETPGHNLSDAMQFINGVFAQRSNRRHGQTGHVFEGRFRSLVIHQDSYLIRAARYVVRNPVRAGFVTDAGAWPWSSYAATAGLKRVPNWLHVDWIRWAFKANSRAEAQRLYIRYVNAPADSQRPVALNADVLGTRQFGKRLQRLFGADKPDRQIPQAIRPLVRPTLKELFDGVQRSASRDRRIYDAHVAHGYRFAEIARYLGVDRSTASKAATRLLSTDAKGGGLAS